MNTYTVAFFGHRELSNQYAIEEKIKPILQKLINDKEYIEFLVGRDGEFDQVAASAVREAVKHYGNGNTSLVLVLPYERNAIKSPETITGQNVYKLSIDKP